jgi:hypothetical protein
MPDEKDSVSFAFDPAPFVNGLNKVNGSIAETNKNTEHLAKKISQGMMSAVTKIGMVAGGFLGIKAIAARIPEIGMVFKTAGDIFFKNLLWPLRKELMPLLQKILNWVRDNRGQFVVWGQTIANIFRLVLTIGKEIFEVAKSVGKAFLDFINNVFGSQIKSFDELLNILTFKFSVIVQFIGGLLRSILQSEMFKNIEDVLGKIIKFFAEIATSFATGFFKDLPSISDTLSGIVGLIGTIIDKLFTGKDSLKFWKDTFESIGQLAGSIVEGVGEMIKTLDFALKGDTAGYDKWYQEKVNKQNAQAQKVEDVWRAQSLKEGTGVFNSKGEFFTKTKSGEYVNSRGSIVHSIDDAIITKEGKIIKTNPEDTIFATKGGIGKTVKVEFGAINLNVTEGNAKQAGTDFAGGIYEGIRSKLNFEFTGAGG